MISVVIPLFNKGKSISSTLKSVLSQSYTDFEVVVVDDGSTDSSAAVVQEIAKGDGRIRLIQKENGGVCSARNRGIKESKGEYVALLDGDDRWDKDYLQEQVKLIEDFPEAAMWGINFAEFSEGKLVRKLATGLPDGYRGYVDNYFQIKGRISDLFCSSSVVIRKVVFAEVGYFDERIRYAEDNDMWWRIIATHRVVFYDRYMAFYLYDAENRALNRIWNLTDHLLFFIDKFKVPPYNFNKVFYAWVMRWAAQNLKKYYFDDQKGIRKVAKVVAGKLDFSIIPHKYFLFYKCPYHIGKILYRLDAVR